MAGGLGAVVVGGFQGLQLLGGDRGARSLIRLIAIQRAIQIEACKGGSKCNKFKLWVCLTFVS